MLYVRVVIASFEGMPPGFRDDEILVGALRARDVDVEVIPWDRAGASWSAFDAVVVRSTWDYPRRRDEFLAWAESLGERLHNRAAVLRWNTEYLGRQLPVLPAREGFPRKVKPLVRLGEREMAAYCVLRGIDYQVEECPMAAGNRHLGYKEALNAIEAQSPGTKHDFYFGFLARASDRFTPVAEEVQEQLRACARCGAPTTGEVCAFCRLVERATAVPVELGRKARA